MGAAHDATTNGSARFPSLEPRAHVRASERRESIEAKGRRYLVEGRLTVEFADGRAVRATCRGAGAVYACGWERGWVCSCPARGRCAHLVALQLVTVSEPAEATAA